MKKRKRRTTEQVIKDEMKKGIRITYKYPSTGRHCSRKELREFFRSILSEHPD